MKDKRKEIKNVLILILVIAIWCATMSLSGIGCPIKFITGISCGGCGMSRAYYYLLTLNFEKAWQYHPLFWTLPIVLLVFVLKKHINTKVYKGIIFTIISAFVILYLFRLIDPSDDIVVFEPKEGFIYKSYSNIINFFIGK